MKWSNNAVRQFIIVCLLLGFGSTYLIIDYYSIPNDESLMWMGEFKDITDISYGYPEKAFTVGLGDGIITNIEMIFIHLSLIIGCFEMFDFALCFEPKKDNDVKKYLRNKYKEWKTKKKEIKGER